MTGINVFVTAQEFCVELYYCEFYSKAYFTITQSSQLSFGKYILINNDGAFLHSLVSQEKKKCIKYKVRDMVTF